MGLSHMKDQLNSKLWLAMQRWFDLKAEGWTKHELKMKGLRENGNMFYATRALLFTGTTRYAYERELKRFVEWCYRERGIGDNGQIKKREFRAYMEHRFAQGGAASEMNKIRAAIVKFGAVYGKYESFHAMSIKMGKKIRESTLGKIPYQVILGARDVAAGTISLRFQTEDKDGKYEAKQISGLHVDELIKNLRAEISDKKRGTVFECDD